MKINTSTFFISATDKYVKDEKSQIAFVGRSNVGKSSLLNMLVNQKKLARTSSTPGRTRLINYFLINEEFYFVDLPGYGFAKASKDEIHRWQGLIEPYLLQNEKLRCICVLVDCRHDASQYDLQMIEFLSYYRLPFIVVATKCDKLTKSKVKPTLTKLANSLGLARDNIIGISSVTGYGKEELLDKIEEFLN